MKRIIIAIAAAAALPLAMSAPSAAAPGVITADKQTFTLRLRCNTYYNYSTGIRLSGFVTIINSTPYTIPKNAKITVRITHSGRYPWVETLVKEASEIFVTADQNRFTPGAQGVALKDRSVRDCSATVTMARPYTR